MSLVLLANRAPLRATADGWAPAIGGLATALLPVLNAQGGAWVAMREPDDEAPLRQAYPKDDPRFTVHRVVLDAAAFEGYYQGMANRVLWPLAHYLIEHTEPDRAFYEAYKTANRQFAEAALAAAPEGAHFWVHDYHLMLVPALLRQARPDARIGHFWHVPWPAPEVLRILPSARSLVRGMLGADLVGFHTAGYAENFREAARDLLGAVIEGERVRWENRTVCVEAHPIGIDVAEFEALGAAAETARLASVVREEAGVERLIVGVDRLDYTKGLLSRLAAFERFLQEHPEWHRRVTLFQVATPSRTGIPAYDQLKREVDETVGRINGQYAEGTWVPVRYRYRAYGAEELAALYRAADVALITPLRDGMNLVAHEFVATDDDGVLILSELTGAADYLTGAVLVNPYDTDGLIHALHTALTMPEEERRQRLAMMKAAVRRLEVHAWAERFLESLDERPRPSGDGEAAALPALAIPPPA
ncbi:MAG TPA: trehalose-6-phosphate synthase [Rubricoccaceae bacterium]|nr:trehalose-6-phosphate synthase [Rubricoccaceae bacterium]